MTDQALAATAVSSIDIGEILARIPHRYPFLLIDRAEDFVAGESIVGIKAVTINEHYFQGHFPDYPVMPGVLIVEAMAQSGAVLMSKTMDVDPRGKTILFASVDACRFRAPVRPGDLLKLNVRVVKARGGLYKFHGKAMVGDKVAAEAEFAAMLVETPDLMSAQIHPTSIVADGAVLGDGVEIGPFCTVGPNVRLGARTRLASHIVVDGHTELGEDNVVYPFAMLGGPPQHTAYRGEDTKLVIGDRNVIREHATMNIGTVNGGGVTSVGSDGFYMIESHVGHDCKVGDHVILTKQATLGGHCLLGDFVIVGGLAAVHQFTRVGRHAMVGGLAAVVKDVIPYGSVWGNHAHLEGLNLVGLKRRGFSRETINTMRAAYRLLFADEGTFQERLDDTVETYSDCAEVMEIIDFIRADGSRPLCLPEREV